MKKKDIMRAGEGIINEMPAKIKAEIMVYLLYRLVSCGGEELCVEMPDGGVVEIRLPAKKQLVC